MSMRRLTSGKVAIASFVQREVMRRASALVVASFEEVLDVEGPQRIAFFCCVGMNQIPYTLREAEDVLVCFVEVPRCGLSSRYRLYQVPEEPRIQPMFCQGERTVVQLDR
jgi:hypothetical protein